ncbi:N-acetyltransferase [Streptomyces sp. TS71-3]|uniref:GNAT family N-acetyltransferase n=1 Tax=Streptomyces sp. TS71-3 TaxID=2733862 RepID=UPI001BB312FD|nr:GNAT family N-acetyltransferase [Streptomyces sp. TS71-3]
MSIEPAVRRYRPDDRPALDDICIRTGHQGGDARELYTDPALLSTIFAAPYAEMEPELTFVLDDGTGRAVGYVLGTADTPRFADRFRDEWLPQVTGRYPVPTEAPTTPTEIMVMLLHHPERMVRPGLAEYPAHLHIDLLPEWQGRGFGRALMHRFLDELHGRGVPAVHLSMVTANVKARAFYDRLGFRELDVPDPATVTYLGRSTARD